MNIDSFKQSSEVTEYMNLYVSFGFQNGVDIVTRSSGTESSSIDHILYRNRKSGFENYFCVLRYTLTDHNPIVLGIRYKRRGKKNNQKVPFTRTHKSGSALVLEWPLQASDDYLNRISGAGDINKRYGLVIAMIRNMTTDTNYNRKREDMPGTDDLKFGWVDDEVKRDCRKKAKF